MENIIRTSRTSSDYLNEEQHKQIEDCFARSKPWIIIWTPENDDQLNNESENGDELDKVFVEVHFSLKLKTGLVIIPMTNSVEQKIFNELTALGPGTYTGYPQTPGAPFQDIIFSTTKTEAEAIAEQANSIINKYFPG